MFTVESTIHLAVPIARMWRLIIDLDRYSDWHPFLTLSGFPVVGNEIGYKYRTRMRSIPDVTSTAYIVRVGRHAEIAWKIGIRRLLEVEEGFQLAKSEKGTFVTHRICCTGLISLLPFGALRRGLERSIAATNRSLARFAQRGTTIARYSLQTKRIH